MEKLLVILIVLLGVLLIIWYTQRDEVKEKRFREKFKRSKSTKAYKRSPSMANRENDRIRNEENRTKPNQTRSSSQNLPTLNDLKREAENAFPRLKVKERNGQIMICEIDHRGELNELLFIKLDRNKPCKIEEKGRFIDSTFPYVPKSAELKRLFGNKLNKY